MCEVTELIPSNHKMLDGGELKTLQFMMMSRPGITLYSWKSFVSIRGATSKIKRKSEENCSGSKVIKNRLVRHKLRHHSLMVKLVFVELN